MTEAIYIIIIVVDAVVSVGVSVGAFHNLSMVPGSPRRGGVACWDD